MLNGYALLLVALHVVRLMLGGRSLLREITRSVGELLERRRDVDPSLGRRGAAP
jgi:hypothetical protein